MRKLYHKITDIICEELRSRRTMQRGKLTDTPSRDLLDFGRQWIADPDYVNIYQDIHVANLISFTIFAALHTSSQVGLAYHPATQGWPPF